VTARAPRAPTDPLRELDAAWKAEVRAEVGASRFAHWFRDAAIESVSGRCVVLAVPTEVHRTWVTCAYPSLLAKSFGAVLGEGVEVVVRVSERQGAIRAIREHLPVDEAAWRTLVEKHRPAPSLAGYVPEGTNDFVVRLLEQTLHGGAKTPPAPIHLFGEAGGGKTHLLEGLCAAWNARTPGSALLLPAKRLAERFVAAIRGGDFGAARAFEHDLDARELLLIDDVDDLATKELTQRALESWFDRARTERRRLVVAGRTHPREIEGLGERLRSRLLGGVVHRVVPPSAATLRRILTERGAAGGARPDDPVLDELVRCAPSVVSAVALLDRWSAVSAKARMPAPVEWIACMVPSAASATTVEEVVRRAGDVVAGHFGIPRGLVARATKHPSAVEARRIAFYLAHRAAAAPRKALALAFGWRSHSSASRALADVVERRRADPAFEALLDGLLARL
jgi:chromosomal replication initiator protein